MRYVSEVVSEESNSSGHRSLEGYKEGNIASNLFRKLGGDFLLTLKYACYNYLL